MIGSLRGTVLERVAGPSAGEVLVEVGGVGYKLAVPSGTLAACAVGSSVLVYVHTHVREDAIVLYGFATRAERVCFDLLIGVHLVGPALALALLSTHGPAALQRIVVNEDAAALSLVPGVGKKTAVRLLLELGAKLDLLEVGDGAGGDGDDGRGAGALAGAGAAGPRADVRAALAGLGYSAEEVREAMQAVPEDLAEEQDSAVLLRHALRRLAGSR